MEAARERQRARFRGTRLLANADTPALRAGACVGPAEVRDFCRLDDVPAWAGIGKSLLKAVMKQHPEATRMSARAYHRILKLARTMARKSALELAGSDEIQTVHLAEAIQYRSRRQT